MGAEYNIFSIILDFFISLDAVFFLLSSNFDSWDFLLFSVGFVVCFKGFSSGPYDFSLSPYGQLLLIMVNSFCMILINHVLYPME